MEQNDKGMGFTSVRKLLNEYFDVFPSEELAESSTRISTGFSKLDELTGGFETGKVYVIGGRPAMGKEELMLSMIRRILLESKKGVLLITTNHLRRDYLLRLLSIHCNIPTSLVRLMKIREWHSQDYRIAELLDAPLQISGELDLKLDKLTEKVRDCVREKGARIVFIDSLQLIDYAREGSSPSERLGNVMYALKDLARQMNLPIVVGSMLNRNREYQEGYEGIRPVLMDLANSSFIGEFADVVMMVHRPEYYHVIIDEHGRDLRGLMQVLVLKNALGPLGEIALNYHSETGKVSQPGESEESGAWQLDKLKADSKAVELLMNALNREE